jgi:peptidoglycan/LPS O-acetylase OafA/YrhL
MRFGKLYDALARVTSGQQLIPVIDGLRFIAIFSVLMNHLIGYVSAKSTLHFSDTWGDRFWIAAALMVPATLAASSVLFV